ncbi:MAG: 1-(5-phosphoribosyl)-5-[(5-phosphoribosylamino)methylideneamino] imidazole-4-carboxamide isomerase, partial [Armatimonadota bacterium]|nr:1-(5-phosphoribosyl)-5-[(5-phosphoribosylamino)methylideneamino] imidazole-4-carboxamide isomerase [Armatimonadota bacterium]
MTVIPAIDLRGGRCVRLIRGDPRRERRYDQDPAEAALRWIRAGARWLHVVDLDGAFAGRPVQLQLVAAIARLAAGAGVQVQAGGGLRTEDDIDAALDAGASRVVIGTAAEALPDQVLRRYGERLAVAVDARAGGLAVRGWRRVRRTDPLTVARRLAARGVRRFVYTATARDGTLAGPDLAGLRRFLAAVSPLPVIAAGGVARVEDLDALRALGVEGVIVGRALYEGRLDPGLLAAGMSAVGTTAAGAPPTPAATSPP